MMTTTTMTLTAHDDADLVIASLSGNRDAFGQIVSRYQSLICSLAYSATGSLGASEDLAQETFIAAWRHLRHLRERHKLKAWLCGIARNRINNTLRREGREPLRGAESLEVVPDYASTEPLPPDRTISKEEEAILWRSLERIPENYREPLVLFYREHQSIESVATALDLTEDAVKQRLSRGRKLLAEEVVTFVEGALGRTNPGKAFTLGVLAALPLTLATSAKAAVLGSAMMKGAGAAKAAGGLGVLGSVLSPLVGLIGPWLQYRMLLNVARSDAERAGIRSYFRKLLGLLLAFGLSLIALVLLGGRFVTTHPLGFAAVLLGLVASFFFVSVRFAMWTNRLFADYRAERATSGSVMPAVPSWEYRSRWKLLGLPLVHIRVTQPGPSTERPQPVKAWFAVGDTAFGVLFAFGGFAVAPLSLGGLAIGLIPWGGIALGLMPVGGFAFGGWAFGGFALGWQAFGGCALAWNAAAGGLAVAREFALGGIAHAAQINNAAAENFIRSQLFFVRMELVSRHLAWLNLFWLIPMLAWWWKLKRLAKTFRQTAV
ncbi:MAG: sigma-70 family RNA polymerase sigma factor [Verrucomicrobiota bacterium]